MNSEPEETLSAIDELASERYVCTVEDYDPVDDLFLIGWTDKANCKWGFWGSRSLFEQIFDQAVLN